MRLIQKLERKLSWRRKQGGESPLAATTTNGNGNDKENCCTIPVSGTEFSRYIRFNTKNSKPIVDENLPPVIDGNRSPCSLSECKENSLENEHIYDLLINQQHGPHHQQIEKKVRPRIRTNPWYNHSRWIYQRSESQPSENPYECIEDIKERISIREKLKTAPHLKLRRFQRPNPLYLNPYERYPKAQPECESLPFFGHHSPEFVSKSQQLCMEINNYIINNGNHHQQPPPPSPTTTNPVTMNEAIIIRRQCSNATDGRHHHDTKNKPDTGNISNIVANDNDDDDDDGGGGGQQQFRVQKRKRTSSTEINPPNGNESKRTRIHEQPRSLCRKPSCRRINQLKSELKQVVHVALQQAKNSNY